MKIVTNLNSHIKDLKSEKVINTKQLSDGYHTIGDLYEHRTILFSIICNQNKDIAWKSSKHFDNDNDPMFEDSFVVGVSTSKGEATYHCKMMYWDLFKVKEIEIAPKWDGHTSSDVLERLQSL